MSEPNTETTTADDRVGGQPADGADPPTAHAEHRGHATDQDLLNESRTAADALSNAVDSLWGMSVGARGLSITAHTVIVGDASVGTLVGRDNLGGAPGHRIVPSGPVPAVLLEQLDNTFVPPKVFEEMRRRLRDQSLLLLRAPLGWGRTAAALRALAEECTAGVHKLNPDVQLRSLEIEFTPKFGYLLESFGAEQASNLRTFHLEQLSQMLTEYGCRMIVVLDSTAQISADVDQFLLDGGEPADATQLVHSHLRWHLATRPPDLLKRAEVGQLLTDVAQNRPPTRDLALLAAELADVSAGRIDIVDVVNRHSAAADGRFRQWFDDELDVETRAFAIALAVFNGMPLHVVSDAGRALAQLIAHEEEPDENKHSRSVFGSRSTQLLSASHAESYRSTEETTYGQIPVQAVKFADDSYPRRVLEYVWQEYHAAHHLVRDWLRDYGSNPNLTVCTRAGVAAGLLSTFEFEHARKLMIEPWATSGERHDRLAAIGALQFPCLQPELAPLVVRMLAAWLRRDQPLPRRVAAAEALGSTVGQAMPDSAITLLRRAARSSESPLRKAASFGLVQLFWSAGLTRRVLSELRKWTGSNRPRLRDTGFRCVLDLSLYKGVDTPQGMREWPVMVWLADAADDHRDDIITLFARLIEAPIHMPAAYEEIQRWVEIAEKDPQLRRPLGRFLISLGQAIQDTEILPYYLHAWAEEPNGPRRAVNELLTTLDSKEKTV
ncbi:hypothetical protein ACIBG0_28860 [Nocardia sp. NPDC050630]|uniref:hypothetical protein n=1 Tax=Nocardia sp. NPDC050630 TaxID=3364321 RepID=UPI0037BD4141